MEHSTSTRSERARSATTSFKTVFIWISIIVAIVSLKRGKWIPNIGAFVRIGVLAFFSITVVIYAIEHGVHGYAAGKFNPFQLTVFLGLVPLLLFNYVGFELQNGAAEEMENPQKDVPGHRHPGRRDLDARLLHPGLRDPRGAAGHQDHGHRRASSTPSHDLRGVRRRRGTSSTQVMAVGFIFALVTSGSVWMMGSDRIQAVAAYDGAFFPWFGKFNATSRARRCASTCCRASCRRSS